MAFNTNFDASNKADFVVDISATDAITGDDIDFTGAAVTIKIVDENDVQAVNATIVNGLIIQPSTTVLELTIPAATMAALVPGTYKIGGIYSLSSEVTQLFVGEFVVYDGIASV